ncbi:MAG: alpha/beta fold hydrolase [Myxococcota bacterium]
MRFVLLLALAGCGTATCPEPAPSAVIGDAPAVVTGDEEPEEEQDDSVLVLDGTPTIPDALRNRLRQYSNTRSAGIRGLNADGSEALIATRFAETSQLHWVQTPLGSRRQLTFEDEPIRGAALVPGADHHVLFLHDIGGNEDNQIFLLDRRTGRSRMLTDGESKHGSLVVSHDGSRIAYSGNGRNGEDMDIYVRGLGDEDATRVERDGYWYPLDFSRDGKKLLIAKYVSINESHLAALDLETNEVQTLTPEEPRANHENAIFGADSETVYVVTDRAGEFRQLYSFNIAQPGADWENLSADIPWNVESIALSGDGRTLALTTNEDGFGKLRLLDVRRGRMQEVEIPQGLIGGVLWASERSVLGFTLYGATRTGDAYTYDTRGRRLQRWTESEVGGLDPETFVEPELVRYPTFDEREIPAFYYRPRGEGPFPVMVYIHGGPESQAQPWFSPLTQFLVVERNIAVIAPNVRGSDGYGKSYLLLDNGAKREDSVKDIGALLDWIATREELDQERTAVYGGSYGGYMVLASLATYGERLRAGIDVVGISNFVTFLENTRDYRRDLRRQEYGDERDPEMRALLERISPTNNVERIQSALFVAQGANDPRVPASESQQIVEAVRQSGHDVWYMLARNEGHGFRRKENRDVFFQLAVLFLDRHLKDDE